MNSSPSPSPPPSPAPESPAAGRRFELPGMFLFFVVVFGSLYLAHAFQEPVMQRFALHGGSPSDEPPWYFITRDFAAGICSAGAFLLCLGVAVVTCRWWPSYASMMVWMALIWHGGNITRSWIIYQSCPGLLEGRRLTSRWPTHQSYLKDHGIATAHILVLVGGFILAVVLQVAASWMWRRLKRKASRREMEGSAR